VVEKHRRNLEMSLEERLAASEAKVSYLEMENEFLKKLDELERRDAKK
jgi:transposase